ncbi:ATP-dependent zinc protease [Candidatus Woesearchaeota archaeon]|nr:ATP-dependent zinc protease [Candidatus Woesearchaeota archaeon]
MKDRVIIGIDEPIIVLGKEDKRKEAIARIDTGARRSSLDIEFAKRLGILPSARSITIRSASGKTKRPLASVTVLIKGKPYEAEFTLISRSEMTYTCLIGRDILEQGFLIDPIKK